MCEPGNTPGFTAATRHDRSRLAQRALACEIRGDLDRAMALIRCLQRSRRASAYPGSAGSAGGERRID